MSGISEEYTCAGWHTDCEYALWATLTGKEVAGVKGWILADEDVAELRLAHEIAGGWLRLSDEQGGPTLLTTSEWIAHLAAKTRG